MYIMIKCTFYFLRVHTSSGYSLLSPTPTVAQNATQICSFRKAEGSACGAVGVLTYDIAEDRKKGGVKRLAIMFSVPHDYDFYSNWFALGLFDTSQACDHSLYELMYYKNGPFKRAKASGSEISHHGRKYTLKGTMSPAKNAEIKVELWD